jgi:HSP20 family protein
MKSLIPWRGIDGGPFQLLRREMDNWFEHFFPEPIREIGPVAAPEWAPRVDVEETDKELVVKADLPGVDPKDVDVSVTEGALVLRGEKKEVREDKKKNYHRVERFIGKFYREIPLPAGVDPDKIAATCGKGVVTVTIPRKPEIQAKIPVKPEG